MPQLLYINSACTADFPLKIIKSKPSNTTWYKTSNTNEFLQNSIIAIACQKSYFAKQMNQLTSSSNVIDAQLRCTNGHFSPSYNEACEKS